MANISKAEYLKKLAPDFGLFSIIEYKAFTKNNLNSNVFVVSTKNVATNFYRGAFYVYPLDKPENVSLNGDYVSVKYDEGYVFISETENSDGIHGKDRDTISVAIPENTKLIGVCF